MTRRLRAAFALAVLTAAVAWGAPALATKTYSCGSRGTDASDLNGCVKLALADPAVISGGVQRQDIVYQVSGGIATPGTMQSISGYTAGAFHNTITFDSSGGFRAYINAHPGSAVYFNTRYGGYISQTGPAAALYINVDNVTIFGVQINVTTNHQAIAFDTAVAHATVDSSLYVWAGSTDHEPGIACLNAGGALTIRNTLAVGTDTADSLAVESYCAVTATYFGYAMKGPVTLNQGAGIFTQTGIAVSITNSYALNFGACAGGAGGENNAYDFGGSIGAGSFNTGSHNATCLSVMGYPNFYPGKGTSPFRYNDQTNAVLATEVMRATDYRLNRTSVKLRGTALHGAGGITVDMLGNARNTLDDIGPLAYAGGTTLPTLAGAVATFVTSGTSVIVPASCNSSNNEIAAIGGGAGGGNGGATGGGGEYRAIYGYPFSRSSPGTTIPITIGSGGRANTAGTATSFNISALVANGGQVGFGGSGGTGFVGNDGGGASGPQTGGGGGAGGPHGNGGNGGQGGEGNTGGGGGGAADGGTAGTDGASGRPGRGGAAGTQAGGGDGGLNGFNSSGAGGNGGAGHQLDATHGAGAGGGAAGSCGFGCGAGGNGGLYGGGGAGAAQNGGVPGVGAQGLLMLKCVMSSQ